MTPESHKRTKSYSSSLFDGLFTTILSLFFNRCLGYHITSIKRYNLIGKLWSNHNDGDLSRAEEGSTQRRGMGVALKMERETRMMSGKDSRRSRDGSRCRRPTRGGQSNGPDERSVVHDTAPRALSPLPSLSSARIHSG